MIDETMHTQTTDHNDVSKIVLFYTFKNLKMQQHYIEISLVYVVAVHLQALDRNIDVLF